MKIAPELLALIFDHAQHDAPNECCGMVGLRDGAAVSGSCLDSALLAPNSLGVRSLRSTYSVSPKRIVNGTMSMLCSVAVAGGRSQALSVTMRMPGMPAR